MSLKDYKFHKLESITDSSIGLLDQNLKQHRKDTKCWGLVYVVL